MYLPTVCRYTINLQFLKLIRTQCVHLVNEVPAPSTFAIGHSAGADVADYIVIQGEIGCDQGAQIEGGLGIAQPREERVVLRLS